MFANKQFRQVKMKRYRENKEKKKRALAEHYKKKRLLCDKCGLCRLSVEEIEKDYEEILAKINIKK